MPRSALIRVGTRAIVASIVLTIIFSSGVVTGLWFYPQLIENSMDDGGQVHLNESDHDDEMHDEEHEEDHIALSKQAFHNLDLRLGLLTKGDYWKSTLVPGKVVEIPGRSDLAVSTPLAGVIEAVNVVPGESIALQSALFEIRLTDEALLAAQAKYLEILTQQEVAEQEIQRLTPLIDSGAVIGAKKRELEYEVKQLIAKQATILQELRGRGMPDAQIESLRRRRTLASSLAVSAPKFVTDNLQATNSSGYSVENLLVHPGKSVSRGDSLCTVAYHKKLYIEGTAFEVDLRTLENIAEKGWSITAETMHTDSDNSHSETLQLKLLRIDNHIDESTQTIGFFVELPNEVTQTLTEEKRDFQQWRFRPGQRLHLRLPVARWVNQITVPADAVVIDGPNTFVFAQHQHEEDSTEAHEEEHDTFIEFEPIPVRVLHRDDKVVVIADDGQLMDDQQIALNHAYKLYLAMQMQTGGGGGHHHHDH